jgi:hypothetical protein
LTLPVESGLRYESSWPEFALIAAARLAEKTTTRTNAIEVCMVGNNL